MALPPARICLRPNGPPFISPGQRPGSGGLGPGGRLAAGCRRPFGALGCWKRRPPGAHAPGYMPLPLAGQIPNPVRLRWSGISGRSILPRMNLTPSSPGVRRIEAPVLVDRKGTVWMPGLIDVTLRLGDRVVLAESPSPEVPPKLAQLLRDGATRFAGARGSSGAFTVSFLADPASGEQRFLSTVPGLPAAVAVVESRNEMDLPPWSATSRAAALSTASCQRPAATLSRSASRPSIPRRASCPAPAWWRPCASPPVRACAPTPPSTRGRCPRGGRRSPASPPTDGPGPRRSPGSSAASPAPRPPCATALPTRPFSPRSWTAPS